LGVDLEPASGPEQSRFEVLWDHANQNAKERAAAIESALDFAVGEASKDWRDFPEGFADSIQDGIAEWKRLSKETEFDLKGIFRRRQLVPFVLIPRHVSEGHAPDEKLSLLTHLQQAHEAFMFGVPFAAIALMRSILELVLKKHYGSHGTNLELLDQ
jgi:hypothetical protein